MWWVEDLNSLQLDDIVESNIFDIGGFKWKLALCRGFRNGHPPELVRIFLFSCNEQGIHADVKLELKEENQSSSLPSERKGKVACPFRYIDKLEIPFNELMDTQHSLQVSLKVIADLKNVREATRDELRSSMINMRTVTLEVITDESIRRGQNQRELFGVVSSAKKRFADVVSYSFVRQWAQQSSDRRYWLCDRSERGGLLVKRFLNHAPMFECFESICDARGGGFPWVTVFREEKKSHESFQPVDDGTILVFCMLCEDSYDDSVYVGHVLVQRWISCQDLLAKIADELSHLQEGEDYRAYIGEGTSCKREITYEPKSLLEIDVQSGSVIVLTPLANERATLMNCA